MRIHGPDININVFKKLFYEDRLPTKKIAEILHVRHTSVANFRYKNKLPTRGWSKPPWLGKKRDQATIDKMRQKMLGKLVRERNPCWKGGRYSNGQGYIVVLLPKHLQDNTRYRYQLEHRFVMEQFLGRRLHSSEVVHHKNGNKHDNWVENLCLYTHSSHGKHHYPKGSRFGINSPQL